MKILFIHVPKNAGTLISANFAQSFGYNKSFSVDLKDITLDEFIKYKENIVRDYEFISGHIPFAFIDELATKFDLIISVVRSPFQRLLSMHSYLSRNADGGFLQFEPDDLHAFFAKHYLSNVSTRNEQCSYLGSVNRFSSVAETLRRFDRFIVLRSDEVEWFMPLLFKKLGLDWSASLDRNESAKKDKADIFSNLNNDLYRNVFAWFDDDYRLWEYLCENSTAQRLAKL